MLYKKIHRQFLRDFGKDDKEIKYSKPYIDNRTCIIFIKTDHGEHYIHWGVINTSGSYKGKIHMTVPPRFEQKIELWFRNFKYGDDDRNDVGRVEKLRCYIKKVHRQFLRQFKKGRKVRHRGSGKVLKITEGPYLTKYYIQVDLNKVILHDTLIPITIDNRYYGKFCADITIIGRMERLRCCIRKFIDNMLENLE